MREPNANEYEILGGTALPDTTSVDYELDAEGTDYEVALFADLCLFEEHARKAAPDITLERAAYNAALELAIGRAG